MSGEMQQTATTVVEIPLIDHTTDPVQSDDPMHDPSALAADWLPTADEPRLLMTLSTIDSEGFPRSRTVMLSEFDGESFFFHTDTQSQKVQDLAQNSRVALTVLWPGFTRQLVVQGTASIAPAAEVSDAYEKRSPYLQQLAWLNTTEYARMPLATRVSEWAHYAERVPAPQQPQGWVGYAVKPHRMLFWVSHPNAASRRVEYTRNGSEWEHQYLPG
ncbi:pyridoxamine 5'-phosphate oxidase [Microbacterium halimionae]|uniref:Pyridoxamine 5'-phosphate oxidase n=1 Tax=Microbacterium halimionae TaxID=1526413 RepID=A0A7W3JRD1_9MICO|nr:pyridoxamine 5'-phosphate oxidase family protein [Microbacterium halimionae]MBA8817488.1 pyridoxamine 5'-phosphate oxidase [Microbacterium halimionae]NII95069.1 pyridoxamine 5'-phosphate oxidase [Microbacterium halimionae]